MPAELNVPAGTYQGSDGVWFMVSMVREEEWHLFCQVLDRPDLPSDLRFLTYEDRAANKAALIKILRPMLASRPAGNGLRSSRRRACYPTA
jgi:crotonobetainyl-CoA:carnitine CoA-transferase CaiB-like acyl-CoA transferase